MGLVGHIERTYGKWVTPCQDLYSYTFLVLGHTDFVTNFILNLLFCFSRYKISMGVALNSNFALSIHDLSNDNAYEFRVHTT